MKKLFSIRTIILASSLLLQQGTLCFQSHAAPGDVDLSFDPGSGVNGGVPVLALQPDGKMIISGSFTTIKGLARPGLARLNTDGSADSGFNPAVAGGGLVALQADGRVLLNTYNGLVRLNADGSLDNSFFASIPAFDEGIYSIAIQPDGKVLIGGGFTVVNGTNRFGIARLNTNGTVDNSFNPGTGAYGVGSIVVQLDGRVLIGGWFQSVNGTNRAGIARLNANGSRDDSFNPDTAPTFWIDSLALQPDGKVVIGGNFASVAGTNFSGIARLNANGSLDSSFNPGTVLTNQSGDYPMVYSLAMQADGKVVVGGSFSVNGTNLNNIARFNTNGTLDGSFNSSGGTDGAVSAVAVQPDGKLLIGGGFTAVHGTNRNYVARLNAGGNLDTSFDPGSSIDSGVLTTALQPDGKLLIGGTFTTVGGLARTGLARLNLDGSVDSTFNPDIKFWATASYIKAVAAQPEGKVLATGIFMLANGTQSASIARFNADGSWDTGFQPDLWRFIQPGDCMPNYGCWQSVEATSVLAQPDGKVLVGGHAWTMVYGDEWAYEVIRPFLARFNTNGTLDGSFTSGTNYSESCLARQPDGKIVVGGVEGISRLNTNGTLDLSFNAGAVYAVRSIAMQSDGKVVIGGGFGAVQGTNRPGLARLNANGSLDGSFNPGTEASGTVYSIALQPDGKVIVGRDPTYDGTNYNTITRHNTNGSLDAGFNPGEGANSAVRCIALQPDGNILLGGSFTTVKGVVRPYVARLHGADVAPSLNITRSNAFMIVSWPSASTGFVLQQNTNLSTTNWTIPSETVTDNGTTRSISASPAPGNRFFRLFKP